MTAPTTRDLTVKGFRLVVRAVRDEPRTFTVSLLGASLAALLTVGSAYVVGAVVARVVVPAFERGDVGPAALALASTALIGLSLLKVVGIYCRRLGAWYMQLRLQARYRRQMIRRYLALPAEWHQRHATGSLLSNASSDVDAAWQPAGSLAYALATVVMLVVALVALLLTDWALALVGIVIFPTLFTVFATYSRRVAPRYKRAQQLRGEVSALAHESFDGALVVKVMGREAHETARFAAKVGELRDVLISIGRIRGVFDPIVDSLPSIGTLAALVVGAWRLRSGAIGVSELVSVAFLFALLDMPVRAIGWLLTSLPRAVAGWERMDAVLQAEGEMPYGPATARTRGGAPARLRFDAVGHQYGGTPVLHDVSLAVPAGRIVALVGPTGSGKSTLITIAARLIDPTEGAVLLDDTDVRGLRAASLASTVALVPQVPFVFDDTVRANVALDRAGLDDGRIWEALRLAQADGFVARLPSGLDTMLGERGVILSGGQRQRLTLARALAGRPRLLLLDDATSAVDPGVEAAMLAALREAVHPPAPNLPTPRRRERGRARTRTAPPRPPAPRRVGTVLIVAHRPATIAVADEVVYFDGGRVVATGAHTDLLATAPGYAELVAAYEQAEARRAPVLSSADA
jgi:ABC-type multidrug transport system fused ATPase/permease subunit